MFFTGVRYERMIENGNASLEAGNDPTPGEKDGKPGRNRKRRRG